MIYVVGHRGAAGLEPENTIRSFERAIELGVDYVECDVHLTRDGHVVVIHDDHVDRTTNGHGAVRSLDLETVRSLDAGGGQQVPTLDEILDVIAGEVRLFCELKGEGVADAALDCVAAHGLQDDVVFTSFTIERLEQAKQRNNRCHVAPNLVRPIEADLARAAGLEAWGAGILYHHLTIAMVDQAHEAGLSLRAWNPDTLREQLAMIALGVDGVSTNRPDILLDHLGQQARMRE
ncbi:MAG: glycerophosphodiester phosphodiesterase [Nitrospiraceae bacterium]|nr:glycerophosphodiester phosphodiesterase [Nitrospiraceae bacterium]